MESVEWADGSSLRFARDKAGNPIHATLTTASGEIHYLVYDYACWL